MTGKLHHALPTAPREISDALEREFAEIESRFARRDWGPAELNGGRFAEALLRLLEYRATGAFTPIGQSVNRSTVVSTVRNSPSLDEAYRIHLPRSAELLMDIRNRRDVAHLGSAVSVNESDAQLVLRLASWSLGEVVRLEGSAAPEEIQRIIDNLSRKYTPLVDEVDGELVVLDPNMTASTRALVALYHTYPDPIEVGVLQRATGYRNTTRFRRLMDSEEQQRNVRINDDGLIFLTQRGVAWVDHNVSLELAIPS